MNGILEVELGGGCFGLLCWSVGASLLECGELACRLAGLWGLVCGSRLDGLLVCEELACWLVGASLLLFLAKDPAKMRKLESGGVQWFEVQSGI